MPFKDPNSEAAKASASRRQKKYREEHPDKVASWPSQTREAKHDRYYQCVHNITLAEFEAQIVKQGGMCPIGNHPFGPRGKGRNSPCQDHNHETNENRMVLCREHNVGLGQFHDSIAELESAILYLKSFKKEKENDNVQRLNDSQTGSRNSATNSGPDLGNSGHHDRDCLPTE